MFLLDANVVSEARRIPYGRADERVRRWLTQVEPTLAYISVVTLIELEIGVMRMERRDEHAGADLRRWTEHQVRGAFEGRILPIDDSVVPIAAKLHVPDPAPVSDALIAATALAHNMSVVTRNVADFSRFPDLNVINPWDEQQTSQSRAGPN